MFTTENGDDDSKGPKRRTSPNTSTYRLRPRNSTRTSSFRHSLSDEESQERQFDSEERGKEPVNILTTRDTDTEVNDQEQKDILDNDSSDSTNLYSFRCILNEEDPDLNNPNLYNCKTCRKGLIHMRSRRIFPEADHCDELLLKNRDLGTNQQNHERYDPKSQEASLASSTVQTISSAGKHLSTDHPSVGFDDQERSNAYHLQDDFLKINVADENEIRSVTSARDEGYNNLAIAHKTKVKAGCSFKCKQCPKRFCHKKSLKNHTLVHGAEARFICDFCSKGFMIVSLLRIHLKVHESNVDIKFPFKCDKCPKQYSSEIHLEQHTLVHGAQAEFICNDCSMGFMKKCFLRRHLKVHEINVDVKFPFKCDKCPKQYSSKINLKQHMMIHGAQAKFICNDCSQGFMDKYSLRRHLKVHEGKFPFKCDKCKKKFLWKRNWKRHIMLVHGGQAKFTCKVCHKGFMDKWHFERHSRIHKTDVEAKCPFKCTKCSKRFSFIQNLNKHMFIHAAQAKIKC